MTSLPRSVRTSSIHFEVFKNDCLSASIIQFTEKLLRANLWNTLNFSLYVDLRKRGCALGIEFRYTCLSIIFVFTFFFLGKEKAPVTILASHNTLTRDFVSFLSLLFPFRLRQSLAMFRWMLKHVYKTILLYYKIKVIKGNSQGNMYWTKTTHWPHHRQLQQRKNPWYSLVWDS